MQRLEEVRVLWAKVLDSNPPEHESWYGYAELCLFLGQEEEYRQARQALLARFGASTEAFVNLRQVLTQGQDGSGFDSLREAVEMQKMPPDERNDWIALLVEIDNLLKRAEPSR